MVRAWRSRALSRRSPKAVWKSKRTRPPAACQSLFRLNNKFAGNKPNRKLSGWRSAPFHHRRLGGTHLCDLRPRKFSRETATRPPPHRDSHPGTLNRLSIAPSLRQVGYLDEAAFARGFFPNSFFAASSSLPNSSNCSSENRLSTCVNISPSSFSI